MRFEQEIPKKTSQTNSHRNFLGLVAGSSAAPGHARGRRHSTGRHRSRTLGGAAPPGAGAGAEDVSCRGTQGQKDTDRQAYNRIETQTDGKTDKQQQKTRYKRGTKKAKKLGFKKPLNKHYEKSHQEDTNTRTHADTHGHTAMQKLCRKLMAGGKAKG